NDPVWGGKGQLALSRWYANEIFDTLGAIQITQAPQPQSAPVGAQVCFSVCLDGSPPYKIQWKRNGVPIAGANADDYCFTVVDADEGACFSGCVTNAWGFSNSQPACLNVLRNPVVTNCTSRGNCHAVYVDYNKPINLDGIYTVTCSNTVDGTITPLVVTSISRGQTPRQVCLAVTPDLQPDTNVYCVTVLGATSQDGLVVDPNPSTCCFIHGAEFLSFHVLYKRYDDVGNGNLGAFLSSAKYQNDAFDVLEADPPGNNDPNFHGFEARTGQRD